MKKSQVFNGNYEDSFQKFLQLVAEDLNMVDFPSIIYGESNPRMFPLVMTNSHYRIKNPNRIAEEIAAVLKNFPKWEKETKSEILIWFYVKEKQLYHVILTVYKNNPRIYVGDGEDTYKNGISWFWTYPFSYDYCK